MRPRSDWVGGVAMLTLLRSPSRRIAVAAIAAVLATGAVAAAPQPAEARVVVGFGFGVPVYPPAYYYPPPHYYYPPPPVVYAPPPPVVYAPPPQEPTVAVNPASAPYTAPSGQTCREYQSTAIVNGVQQPTH